MPKVIRSIIVSRYLVWKARDDEVQRLHCLPMPAAVSPFEYRAKRDRQIAALAAALRKRDRLNVPGPWLSWYEFEAELKQRGQI